MQLKTYPKVIHNSKRIGSGWVDETTPSFFSAKTFFSTKLPFFSFPHTGLQAGLDSTLALKFERHPKEDPPSPQKTNCPAPAAFHLVSGLLLVAVTHFGRDLSPSPSGLQAPFHTIRASVPVANEGRERKKRRQANPARSATGRRKKKKKSPLPPSPFTPLLSSVSCVKQREDHPDENVGCFLESRAEI